MSSRWTFTGILNLFCDFDLDHNRAIPYFHETIHLMMICHQTKFACKRISSWPWPWRQQTNLFERQSGSCITIPNKVVKGSAIQKILSGLDKHLLTFWNFAVSLTLSTTIHFLHKTLWFIIMYYQTKFGCKRISSSKDTVEIVIFWSYELLQWPWPWR